MIVVGAGGAAHLPGMVAVMTGLSVIGVPVKGSSLEGSIRCTALYKCPSVFILYPLSMVRPTDKFFSTWQRGIPVATVAINNGTNAGLLAVRILSAGNPDLVRNMEEYRL